MNKILLDFCILFIAFGLYGIEYLLAHRHTPAGVLLDIALVGIFFYKVFRKQLSQIGFLLLFFPIASLLNFISQQYFRGSLSEIHILMLTALIFIYAFYETFGKGSSKRIIAGHIAATQTINNPGKYPVYINKDILIPEQSRYTHLQVIGATGSGKTRFIFYPHILQDIINGAGIMIFDIKSNMREKIESYVAAAGREKDYQYFNLGDPNSYSYNPQAGEDPGEIYNRAFTALYYDMTNSEQFYIDVAKRFLPAATAVLKKKYSTITFEDLYWITANPKTYLQPICNEMPDDINARYLLDFLRKPDLDKYLMGIVNKLAQFVTPSWTSQINTTTPEIDIGKVVSEGKILLFQANSGVYQQEYKPISILLMMHIQSEIARRYSMKAKDLKPFFIYLDEFDKIVYPGFSELINKAREAKVGLIFGHQSIGDLKQYGEALQNQILTNARNKIICKLEDPATVEYFSKSFGTRTIERRVTSYGHDGNVSGYTNKQEEEFNIHPNDIKFLNLGQACIKIEDGYSGQPFINVINFQDIKRQFPAGQIIQHMGGYIMNGKRTNLDLNKNKSENIVGKSGGLKWKHIKANAIEAALNKNNIEAEINDEQV